MAAGMRFIPQIIQQQFHLVDVPAIRCQPVTPLGTIDGPQAAIFVGPLIPYRNAIFIQVGNIGIAFQKP